MVNDSLPVKGRPSSAYMRRGPDGSYEWSVTRQTEDDVEFIRGDIVRASAARAAFMWHHLTGRAGIALGELRCDCEASCNDPTECKDVEHCYIRNAIGILKKMVGEG